MLGTWLGAGIVGWLVYLAQTDVEGEDEMNKGHDKGQMSDREVMKLAANVLANALSIDFNDKRDWYSYKHDAEYAASLLRQALEQPDPFSRLVRIMGTFDLSTGHADNWNDLLDSLESELRDVLGYYRETFKVEQECSTHPDAPHGFNRDASHNYGRYVCDCEGWEPSDDDAAWAKHLKEPMSEKRVHESDTMERECNPHPDAPHGFNRDASHGLGRYVCDCEGWEPPTVSQEPQTMPEKTDDVAQETQPDQEPVAWKHDCAALLQNDVELWIDRCPHCGKPRTAPPKRKWIGLTDEEIDLAIKDCKTTNTYKYFRAIEAKLKEKNT
jgi:hypothetical protein